MTTTLPVAPPLPRVRRTIGLSVVGLLVVMAGSLTHQLVYGTLAEDAYISLRYSAQLLAGNGLVFNPGEPVEGYSNFLWVVLVAAGGLVHDNLVDVARGLGVLCTLAGLVAVWQLVRRATGSGWSGVAAAALTAAAAPVAAYGPSALESPGFALLVLGVLLALQADRHALAGVLLAAATMTRPEGAVLGAVVLGALLLARRWRPAGRLLLAAAVPVAVWTAWRISYYHHVLPNPIAAKSGAPLHRQLEGGLAYLGEFAAASWPLLLLAAVGTVAAVVWGGPRVRPLAVLVAVLAVAHVGFFTATGGDWMPAWRFFAPDVPLLGLLVGLGLAVLPRRSARAAAAVAVAAAVVGGVLVSMTHPMTLDRVRMWEVQVHELASTGAWLQRSLPSGTTIATFANGALSYEARDLEVVDLLGLTDEHIARHGQRDPAALVGHGAHDYPYVVDVRRPEVVVLSGSGWYWEPSCAVPDALPGYEGATFSPAPGRWMTVYLRADQAGRLAALLNNPGYRYTPCP